MIIIYVAIMMGIGVYTSKQAKSVNDFVLGGRNVGSWLTAFAYGTSYFSAVVFIGYAGQFGWKYGIAHQYDNGYGIIESRYAFDKYWAEHYGTDNVGNRRLIFGHTHRQCIHILGDGMEWLNPGSASYRRPDDPDKTAHYAICTAFMALGLMLPGMAAGWLQEQMGYENFFWWVMGCCLVTLLVTACLKIDPEFGKKKQGNN